MSRQTVKYARIRAAAMRMKKVYSYEKSQTSHIRAGVRIVV